jgi:putative ABC transport system ATP-binding protein
MIEINDLTFEYPGSDFRFNLNSLNIKSGNKVALIGPSGYGKTTLLNLISGILEPIKGTIHLNGTEVTKLADSQRRNFRITNIGFVFQNFELIEYLNVLDNILLSYRINPSLSMNREVIDRAETISEQLGLGDKLKRNVGKLSQGEMQRVAICRAILNNPKIILADEPTGNLDPRNKEKIIEILFDYSSRENATLITVTHDHSLLKGFDEVLDMQQLVN